MKKLLTITALTLTVIIGGVVWYVQSTSTNHQNTVIARSETTKQSRSNDTATTTPFTTNTAVNAQNHNTTTDTAIRYNADGSIDTSNWQEYCNQEYGFCVKYPQGWEVEWKRLDECNVVAKGIIISSPYVKTGRYCEGPRNADATVGIFYWFSFYFSAIDNPDYDVIKNANSESFLVYKGDWNVYNDILVDGNGETCGNLEGGGETILGLQLINPPEKWENENQVVITCRNEKYVPILRSIFNSIKIIR